MASLIVVVCVILSFVIGIRFGRSEVRHGLEDVAETLELRKELNRESGANTPFLKGFTQGIDLSVSMIKELI